MVGGKRDAFTANHETSPKPMASLSYFGYSPRVPAVYPCVTVCSHHEFPNQFNNLALARSRNFATLVNYLDSPTPSTTLNYSRARHPSGFGGGERYASQDKYLLHRYSLDSESLMCGASAPTINKQCVVRRTRLRRDAGKTRPVASDCRGLAPKSCFSQKGGTPATPAQAPRTCPSVSLLHYFVVTPRVSCFPQEMRLVTLLLLALIPNAFAAQAPYGPDMERRLFALESKILPSNSKGVVRAVWDPSSNSNHGSSSVDSGVHGLGVFLPKGALITDSYAYVDTAPSPAAPEAYVGFQCEDSNNILAQTNLSSPAKLAGEMFAGIQRGMSTVAGGKINSGAVAAIGAPCEVSAKVTTNAWSAGKVVLFLEYVLASPDQ